MKYNFWYRPNKNIKSNKKPKMLKMKVNLNRIKDKCKINKEMGKNELNMILNLKFLYLSIK
jgi:hypothetical protein